MPTPRALALALALLLVAPAALAQEADPAPPGEMAAAPESSATSASTNLFGGRLASGFMLYATAGFPDVELGALVPLGGALELRPRARMLYGRAQSLGLFALAPAVELRWHILSGRGGDLDVAVLLAAGVTIGLDPSGHFVIPVLWPGVAAAYRVSETFDLDFGLQVQDSVLVNAFETGFGLFVSAFGGVEGRIADGVQLGLKVEMGPDVVVSGSHLGLLGTRFHLRAVAGIGLAL